jgi:hypothetical protein
MKLRRVAGLAGVLVALGFLTSNTACSDDGGSALPVFDAGARGDAARPDAARQDGGGEADGGDDGGVATEDVTLLREAASVLGVMDDGTVILLAFGAKLSLVAVPITGGTPTVINPDVKLSDPPELTDDSVQVSGGAVGIWTNVDGATGLSRLSIWTKANGLKEASTTAPVADLIAASSNGAKVAFVRQLANGDDELAIALTNFAAPAKSVFADISRGNAANPCDPTFRFVGANLFASVCPGGGTTTATIVRTDESANPNQVIATQQAPRVFSVNTAGDRLFTHTRPGVGRVFTIPATGNAPAGLQVDTGVSEGRITPDGNSVLYIKGTNLMRASATAPVNAQVVGGPYAGLLAYSSDFKFALTHKLAPAVVGGSRRFDIQLTSTNAGSAPVEVVATATALPLGFTANGSHALFLPTPQDGKLKARAVTAGAVDRDVATIQTFAGVIEASSSVLFGDNAREVTVGADKFDVVDLKLVDVAQNTATATVLTGVGSDVTLAKGKRVIYFAPSKGMMVKTLP